MARLSLVVLLLFGGCATSQVPIPQGSTVDMDGTLESTEWAQAHRLPLEGGGSVLLQHDSDAVYIGFEALPDGWAHVYLSESDSVHVLHASAALGTATYARQGDLWRPVRSFTWEVRGQTLTEELRAARRAFLSREGWAASTMAMGTPGEIEFRIERAWIDASDAIAFVYSTGPDAILHSPEALSDATVAPLLVRGDTPDSLRFETPQWHQLDLE
ncbi:MAG: hypothetical protein AAF170_11695 [Bacteroidota bacterium]